VKLLVFVTFEELKKGFFRKVLMVISARFPTIQESEVQEEFLKSEKLQELRSIVLNKFGGDVPFLETDRLEDQFLIGIIDEVQRSIQNKLAN
jgi:hypothetical protein